MDRVTAHELTKYNFVKFMIRQVQTSTYKLDPAMKSGNELISCKYHFLSSCMYPLVSVPLTRHESMQRKWAVVIIWSNSRVCNESFWFIYMFILDCFERDMIKNVLLSKRQLGTNHLSVRYESSQLWVRIVWVRNVRGYETSGFRWGTRNLIYILPLLFLIFLLFKLFSTFLLFSTNFYLLVQVY